MTQIKPDKIIFYSGVDTYLNFQTYTGDIVISGTVANGASESFETVISVPQSNTRADVYLQNLNTGIKRPIENGLRLAPYQNVSTEVCRAFALFGSGNQVTVFLSITNNTGATITLTNQTIRATIVAYVIPL